MWKAHSTLLEIQDEIRILEAWKPNDRLVDSPLRSLLCQNGTLFLTGSGTSYHAALYSSFLLHSKGRLSIPFFASECEFFINDGLVKKNTPLIAYSQSGESSDTLGAARLWKKLGGKVVAVTNEQDSALFQESDIGIHTNAGPERALPATKSFLGQLLASLDLASLCGMHKDAMQTGGLAVDVRTLIEHPKSVQNLARQKADHIVVLGSALNLPIAMEGALKIREMCGGFSEAYPTREFMHGPKRALGPRSLVLLLSSNQSVQHDLDQTCRVLDISGFLHDNYLIDFGNEIRDSICKLVFLQLFAYYRAVVLGQDPDSPPSLTKIVR